MSVRVLVVDDSAVMRALITRKLACEGDIEVVAAAANAAEARALIKQHDPDVVTLDIEMPGMDGLAFLEKIMALRPTPVVIISGSTGEGAAATTRALRLGAVGCYAKSQGSRSIGSDDGGELAELVREAANVDLKRRPAPATEPAAKATVQPATPLPTHSTGCARRAPELIAIGSSTGGVEALHTLLAGFPEDCPPTLIVQHVHASFAPAIVQSLSKIARPQVALAESDVVLRPGMVVVAPGGKRHLAVRPAGGNGFRSVLREGEPVSGHLPSADCLFASVAECLGNRALGILLTGMGEDGARGMKALVEAGAHTIAQDEASCVVFGMPRAAIAMGGAREVVPLDRIADAAFAAHPSMERAV